MKTGEMRTLFLELFLVGVLSVDVAETPDGSALKIWATSEVEVNIIGPAD